LFVAIAALCGSAKPAFAKDKMALLIGNSAYPGTPNRPNGWTNLPNPVNDVTLVQGALKDIDFDVTVVPNGDWKTLDNAINDFAQRSKGAKIVLFYFAGHGFEYARHNYLVPIDAPSTTTSGELAKRFLDFDAVANRLATAPTTVFLLDACRTGGSFVTVTASAPGGAAAAGDLATPARSDDGARGTTLGGSGSGAILRGGVNDYDFPPGAQVAVLYSTGRGIPARDAAPPPANYSPFAWEVAQRIAVPHVEISTVFNTIRQGVYDRTQSFRPPQAPYTYNSLSPNVYLNAAADRLELARPEQTSLPPKPLTITTTELERVDEPVLITRVLSEHSVSDIIRLADGGDPLATYLLGYMQEFGIGVPRDLTKARATLEKAASYRTPSGLLELAYFLHYNATDPDDRARAVSLYKAAADLGFAKARGHYAGVLMTGRLVPPTYDNYQAGLAQLRLAAKSNYPYALFSLALSDAPQARPTWRTSLQALADAGDADAHHWLCTLDLRDKRYTDAMPHCSIAAAAGFSDSQAHMALAADSGWTSPRSSRDAIHWMRQALSRSDLNPGLRAQMLSLRISLGDKSPITSER
jgi:TPR repeat protein